MRGRVYSLIRRVSDSPTILSQAGLLVGLGSFVLVLPLMSALLPASDIALWLYYSLFISLGLMTDFGFGQALTRAAAYFRAGATAIPTGEPRACAAQGTAPNTAGLESLLATFLRCYRNITALSLLVAGLVGWLCAAEVVAKCQSPVNAAWAGVVIWLGLALSLRVAIWANYLQGLGCVAQSKRIELVVGLARIAAYVAALIAGHGVLCMAVGGFFCGLWQFFWIRSAAIRAHVAIGAGWPVSAKFDSSLFSQLWPATWRQGVIGIGGYLITQAGGLLSSRIGDLSLMAAYLFTLRLFSVIRGLALAPVQAAVPRFVSLRASSDQDGFLKEYKKRILFSLAVATVLSIGVWIGVGHFVANFSRDLRLLPAPMFWLGAIAGILEINHCAHSIIYITKNRVPFLAASLVSGAAILVFGSFVVDHWAVWGLLWVQTIVQLSFNNWYPVYLVLKDLRLSTVSSRGDSSFASTF